MRRLAAWAALAAVVVAAPVRAGTYLDGAALLFHESRHALDVVQRHPTDTKLAAVAHGVAEARVRAGRLLVVPKEAEKAHPHLLLSLEVAERAIAAAADGDPKKFYRLAVDAREEERTMRAVLADAKLALPDDDHGARR